MSYGEPSAAALIKIRDPALREDAMQASTWRLTAILTEIQRDVHERAVFAPIWQLAAMNAIGPRVAESGFGLIPELSIAAPYEDMTLNGR